MVPSCGAIKEDCLEEALFALSLIQLLLNRETGQVEGSFAFA